MPMFEPEVAKEIAVQASSEGFKIDWEEVEGRFVVKVDDGAYEGDPPEEYRFSTVNVAGKPKELCALGSGSWCWDDYDSPEDAPGAHKPRG